MKAVVQDTYGPPEVLRLEEVDTPVPKDDEVLVRVYATSVTRTDCGVRGADPFFSRVFTGLLRPKQRIAGMEFAGEVAAVGAAVTEFHVGDRVFGMRSGSNAEFVCVREHGALAHLPTGMSFEDAGAVSDGAIIALACLRKADPLQGRRVVIYGASGAIELQRCSWRSTSAHTSRPCATPRTSSSCDRSALTRSSTTCRRTSRGTARPTTSSWTQSASNRSGVADSRWSRAIYIETDLGFMWHVPPLALLTVGSETRGRRSRYPSTRRRTSSSSRSSSKPGSSAGSSTGATRSRTWSRQRSTSRPARRRETSS